MEMTWTEIQPQHEMWFGPTNNSLRDYTRRYNDSTQHLFAYGGEGSPLNMQSVVRVDYALAGQPNRPSEFYGPGTARGPFVFAQGSNRSMSVNPNEQLNWFFVFLGKEGV
jgi:hypothetical protein